MKLIRKSLKKTLKRILKADVSDLFLISVLSENDVQDRLVYLLTTDRHILAVIHDDDFTSLKNALYHICESKKVHTKKQLEKALLKIETPIVKLNNVRHEMVVTDYNDFLNETVNNIFNYNRTH